MNAGDFFEDFFRILERYLAVVTELNGQVVALFYRFLDLLLNSLLKYPHFLAADDLKGSAGIDEPAG